jgi:hypothetical protein
MTKKPHKQTQRRKLVKNRKESRRGSSYTIKKKKRGVEHRSWHVQPPTLSAPL